MEGHLRLKPVGPPGRWCGTHLSVVPPEEDEAGLSTLLLSTVMVWSLLSRALSPWHFLRAPHAGWEKSFRWKETILAKHNSALISDLWRTTLYVTKASRLELWGPRLSQVNCMSEPLGGDILEWPPKSQFQEEYWSLAPANDYDVVKVPLLGWKKQFRTYLNSEIILEFIFKWFKNILVLLEVFTDEKWKWKGCSLSRVQLFGTPWTIARQAPQSMKFSRQEYWSG